MEHIDKHNQVARNILLQLLASLLQYPVYDCAAEKVGLQKEIAYIRRLCGLSATSEG